MQINVSSDRPTQAQQTTQVLCQVGPSANKLALWGKSLLSCPALWSLRLIKSSHKSFIQGQSCLADSPTKQLPLHMHKPPLSFVKTTNCHFVNRCSPFLRSDQFQNKVLSDSLTPGGGPEALHFALPSR